MCSESRHSRLKEYCATRCVERHDCIFVFFELYEPLLNVLNSHGELSLVHQITGPQFIVPVVMLSKVLGLTKGLSEGLQVTEMDLVCAVAEIETVSGTLRNW